MCTVIARVFGYSDDVDLAMFVFPVVCVGQNRMKERGDFSD
jgi:hypothetical protein